MESSQTTGKSDRLNQLIVQYFERIERGEEVDHDAFLAEHPLEAAELRSFLASVQAVERPGADHVAPLLEPHFVGSSEFGRYHVSGLIARGGMGEVYLAYDSQLRRNVALKVPRTERIGEAHRQICREARAAAKLHHPNICPVYDVGEIDGRPYLTMALIPGKPLRDCVGKGSPWDERRAAFVIHRDLKPSNIMLTDCDEPIVMDFGLARQLRPGDASASDQTPEGTIVGSPEYMSPEQASGNARRVGPQSDIFSLGVMLYEMLTGRKPFQGNTLELIGAIQHIDPPLPGSLNSGIDPRLESICMRMMARRLDQRCRSMIEIADMLEELFLPAGTCVAPHRPDTPKPGVRAGRKEQAALIRQRRQRLPAIAMLVTAVMALGVPVIFPDLTRSRHGEDVASHLERSSESSGPSSKEAHETIATRQTTSPDYLGSQIEYDFPDSSFGRTDYQESLSSYEKAASAKPSPSTDRVVSHRNFPAPVSPRSDNRDFRHERPSSPGVRMERNRSVASLAKPNAQPSRFSAQPSSRPEQRIAARSPSPGPGAPNSGGPSQMGKRSGADQLAVVKPAPNRLTLMAPQRSSPSPPKPPSKKADLLDSLFTDGSPSVNGPNPRGG